MMKEIETLIGGVLISIGFALLLSLPPAGWPEMPTYWKHAGYLFGAISLVSGIILLLIGIFRYFDQRRFCGSVIARWDRMWTRSRVTMWIVAAATIVVLGPYLWSPAKKIMAEAQPVSRSTGDCNNNGINNGTINNNCATINVGPPRRLNVLYQNDQVVGIVSASSVGVENKKIALTNMRISSGIVDLHENFELNDMTINCPTLPPNRAAAQINIMINGTISCDIVFNR